ncbi:hypothetical protein HDR58_01595 [bacterium]|nr:hypothetical protein [bacterium]
MKSFTKLLALTLSMAMISSGIAMAETTFTPLNFEDSSSAITTTSSTTSTVSTDAKGTDLLAPAQVTGGTKMQNSILQIENAQVEIRNKLLNYKNNYAEIDSRYQTTKAERKAAKKQIKYAEKKIKNLDNAKKKIRKNFQRNMNI